MSDWLTDGRLLFMERTARVTAYGTLVILLGGFLWAGLRVYDSQPDLSPASPREPVPVSEKLSETASELAPFLPWFALPIPFYWLAHFLRVWREDGGDDGDASA